MPAIAFYAPMKPPDSPVPSGDRLMARQLLACLGRIGTVTLASRLVSRLPDPDDGARRGAILIRAETEVRRLDQLWRRDGVPDLFVCYHSYYKSPDLIGPTLCARHGVPYVTVEASWSERRNIGHWSDWQARARAGIAGAALNICITRRDAAGLGRVVAPDRLAYLGPFIDAASFLAVKPAPAPGHLGVVAMMRAGDKFASYRHLAAALAHLDDLPWRLSVIGEGPMRGEILGAFAGFPGARIAWLGVRPPDTIAGHLATLAVFAWPGVGEAYGLAYLEAQAAGVPAVALDTAGVPEVVRHGETGLLCPTGDPAVYAEALRTTLQDHKLRQRLARGARARVAARHDMGAAATRLSDLLTPLLRPAP